MSFPGRLNFNVSSSTHLRQTRDMLSLDSEQLRRERWTSVKRWLLTILETNASPRTIFSEILNERDLRGLDHDLVKLTIVVQNVGTELPGVGTHCVSIARWCRWGSGEILPGIERDDSCREMGKRSEESG